MGGDHDVGSADQCESVEPPKQNISYRFTEGLWNFFASPVEWFRHKVVEPNRQVYPWYHRQIRRVPTIDQCYTDDEVCVYEADQQYKRDMAVDNEIISILRYRMDDCVREEFPDYKRCLPLKEAYEVAAANWFTKYGDLSAQHTVTTAYMKQKHRMLWERRHGPVGSGMKKADICADPDDH